MVSSGLKTRMKKARGRTSVSRLKKIGAITVVFFSEVKTKFSFLLILFFSSMKFCLFYDVNEKESERLLLFFFYEVKIVRAITFNFLLGSKT